LYNEKYASRSYLSQTLHIGEGAVKTLISHLKQAGLADSTRSGTFLTKKGIDFLKIFFSVLSSECKLNKCNIAQAKFNHAVLLRNYSNSIKSGIQQRDFAVMYGAIGATTLLYKNNQFIFPGEDIDCLYNDKKTKTDLIKKLSPHNGDVIIIASANESFIAEISAKNSALWTLATHEKH
jgi:hypothetical protein